MIDGGAANNTKMWVGGWRARAQQAGSNFVDWLARIYRAEHGMACEIDPSLAADQRVAIDRLDTALDDLTDAERRLHALLDRHEGLADRGARRGSTLS